jgi:hypothetical protein
MCNETSLHFHFKDTKMGFSHKNVDMGAYYASFLIYGPYENDNKKDDDGKGDETDEKK